MAKKRATKNKAQPTSPRVVLSMRPLTIRATFSSFETTSSAVITGVLIFLRGTTREIISAKRSNTDGEEQESQLRGKSKTAAIGQRTKPFRNILHQTAFTGQNTDSKPLARVACSTALLRSVDNLLDARHTCEASA